MNRFVYTLCLPLVFLSLKADALNQRPPPYGQLSVRGNTLIGPDGRQVQLVGISLFWSQWMGQYYTKDTVDALACRWGVNVVRVAMGVDQGGYLSDQDRELRKVRAVVEAAIERGIYVIIDWHIHEAQNHKGEAVQFFKKMASDYGRYPHVLYELWNEPLQVSWDDVIKPYHQLVLQALRAVDPDNVVLLGTPSWSGASGITDASNSPLHGQRNIMYVQHFYSGTHRDHERNGLSQAARKIPVFVSEYGVSEADGGSNRRVYTDEANKWFQLMDSLKVSYVAWSLADKNEASAALRSGTQPSEVGIDGQLTVSGRFLKNMINSKRLVSCDDEGGDEDDSDEEAAEDYSSEEADDFEESAEDDY